MFCKNHTEANFDYHKPLMPFGDDAAKSDIPWMGKAPDYLWNYYVCFRQSDVFPHLAATVCQERFRLLPHVFSFSFLPRKPVRTVHVYFLMMISLPFRFMFLNQWMGDETMPDYRLKSLRMRRYVVWILNRNLDAD